MLKTTTLLVKKSFLSFLFLMIISIKGFGQSSNCATATQITLVGGTACVNGTNVGAITDNILYGGCNASAVNMVWYTYVTNGSNNTFTVDPGTMTNPEIVIYQGNCPNGAGAALQTCTTAAGGANIYTSWGMTAGDQVWIGIASTSLNDGTFQLCINSQPPAAGAGFTCAQAIPLCNMSAFTNNPMIANSSGQSVSCFGSAPQRDIWIKFTITQAGLLAWRATCNAATEFDWALWDITNNCPNPANGTAGLVCCNYNYASGSGTGFGMAAQAGTVACGNNGFAADAQEFSPPVNVTCGKTYAIQISNYSNNNNGFTLNFTGSTCVIGSSTNFGVSPQLVCGTSLNAAMTNSSTGTCAQVWDFGDGSATYTGGNPPAHNYTTPGTYAITANTGGACPSSFTQFVQLLAPLAATISATPVSCAGLCNGTARLNDVTGGNGVYAYSWSTGATTSSVSALCAGIYSVTITNTVCGTSITKTVSVTSPPPGTLTTTGGTVCVGGSAGLSASGATTYTWSPPTGLSGTSGAAVTANPTVSTIYTVNGTLAGCPLSNTVAITVNPLPSITLSGTNPTCGNTNGVIVINNTSGAGQGPFGFAASAGALGGQTVTAVPAGVTTVSITNTFGCRSTATVNLVNQPGPTAITSPTTSATCGLSNGSFSITGVTGGTPAYTYSLNGVSTSTLVTGLAPGTYTLLVRDFNGCTFTKNIVIINTPGPTAIAGTPSPASCIAPSGSYTVTGVTGGTPAYSFSVDAVATGSVTTGLSSGTHTISVRDLNGCTFSTTFNIVIVTGPTSMTVTSSNATCGSSNGTSTVTAVLGGTPTYSYSFDGGGFSATNVTGGLLAGTHTVTIRDANSCTLTTTYNVLNTGSPTASITNTTNVTCNGLSNGSFTVAGAGGSGAPFTYTLTSPFTTNGTGFFSGLPAGTYNTTIRDAAGCTTTASVTITQPTPVVVTATAVAAKCFGTATGTVNLTGSGGTPGYMYNFNGNPYQASSSFTTMGAAVYNMGIRDMNGCTSTQTIQVTQPAALAISLAPQNANCTAANGIISTTVTGGTPIYTYTWTGGGGAGATTNSLVAGSYSVTVTDNNGCVITGASIIGTTPGGSASITGSANVTCNGANNGSMTAGMTGGSAPFTYSWSPGGQTSATAINLSPNTYTCEITDFYGCKANASATITQPSVLNAIMNSNNVKCFGTATGTVSAAGTGGTAPYTYLWTTLASTLSTVNNVAIGTHSCNITDANNCTIIRSIIVTQPTSITLTSSVTAASCNQSNGSATVTAAGGTPAYSYTWSTGTTGPVLSNTAAGTYTIIVQDGNNCQQTLASTIPNLSGPSIAIASQTNVSCFGGTNGTATSTVTGGATPYLYQWSNGQVTPTGSNLLAGVHSVTVTDNVGCVASTSVSITQPTALTVNITPTHPKCFGSSDGHGIAAALGGTAGYSYVWTTTGGSAATSNPYGAGQHGVTVTDGNGCTATATINLVNPPAMAASITSTNVTCFNACNAIAVGSSTNGVGAVSYYWTGGASPISAQTALGLCVGTYTLLATDQNSCTAGAQVTITQPTQVTANITSSGSVTCNGGTNGFAQVTPAGGTPAYSYTWSGVASAAGNSATANGLAAGTYTVIVADVNGCTATTNGTIIEPAPLATTLTTTDPKCNGISDGTGNIAFSGGVGVPTFLWKPFLQTGSPVNNLAAGNQTVTITYNGSCQTSLTFTLVDPPVLTAAATATNSHCSQNDGKACATVTGGTAPLSYLWSNGLANSLCINNAFAGAYTFTVTDANGCTAQASGLVNDIAGPSVAITSTVDVKCNGGADGGATASIIGGTPNYNISWTGVQAAANTTTLTTNFGAGIHNITVTDAAGCIGTASVTIAEPAALTSAITSFTNVSCNAGTNGGATMLANGGTTAYNYSWTPSGQTSSILTGVAANTYTCRVTDANGCQTSKVVTILQPAPFVMTNSVITHITCNGFNNGQISTTLQGGTPGYSYTWTPVQPSNPLITNLAPGAYNMAVTDQNGCPLNANFTVNEPSVITSNFTALPAKCGVPNGSATVTVNGGTQTGTAPFYNISWNTPTPQTGVTATGMGPGTNWQAVITDANGCSHSQAVTVPDAPSPIITGFTTTQPLCYGQSNGAITINYTSGTPSYTVAWSAPISQVQVTSTLTQSVTGVASGAYSATVTDTYGCTVSQPVVVAQPPFLALNVSANQTICYGQNAQIYATAGGGVGPYTYTWTPIAFAGAGPHTVNPLTSTQYNVAMSDNNGCTPQPRVITVSVTPPLAINGYSATKCDGETAMLTPNMSSNGNGGPYNFIWSNGTTHTAVATSSVMVTANFATNPNTYTVTVDDGCTSPSASAVFTVNVNPLPIINFSATPRSGCAPLTVSFTGTSDNPTTDQYTWYADSKGIIGNSNPQVYTFTTADSISIDLTVTSAQGCTKTLSNNNYIVVYKQPIAAFVASPSPTVSILDPNFNFINQSEGATNYFWDFGDPAPINGNNTSTLVDPSHAYSHSGTFNVHLVAISPQGCTDTTMLPVTVTPDFALYIPNTFTPDGNGVNDMFQPMGVGINEENYRMDIFDRWGETIFTSNNFRKGWDGSVKGNSKMAPQGVYVYKLTVYDLEGNKHPFVGHVTVIKAE